MLRLITAYNTLLLSRPTLINFLSGGTLALAGDVVCQRYLEGTGPCGSESPPPQISWPRALSMTAFGSLYSGGVCVRVFALYPSLTPRIFETTAVRRGAWASFLDNFVHVPVLYTPGFYAITVAVREYAGGGGGGGVEGGELLGLIWKTLEEKYKETVVTCWAMWIPLQTVTFSVGEISGGVWRWGEVNMLCGLVCMWVGVV